MAGRLEWQPIAAQGLNPLGALSTSIGAFQGAAGTAQLLRNNERANETLIQNSYTDLIKSHLGAGNLELAQQKEAREAQQALVEASFNPAEAERIFTDHFAAGGTPENFVDNPNVMGLINQYGDSAFKHGIQTFNRFNAGVEKEVGRLTALAESKKAAELLEINSLEAPQAVKDSMISELESKYANITAGIQATAFNNFANLSRSNRRYLGLEPEEATTGGRAPNPVERQVAKSNDFREYMSQLHTQRSMDVEQLEQDYSNGLINETEYSRQKEELDENFNQQLRQLGKDFRQYNMVSGSGEVLTFDYTELPDGGIQVGNRTIPANIGNALRTASNAFGVPMETLLAFANLESSFNPNAESPSGVKGLMQVTTDTSRDMYNRYRNVFESHGITSTANRNDPTISALTGAAYIAHIRDNILQGDAPIEQVYVAYNLGPDNPLVKQFHNKNVPIDKLPGVDVKSKSIQNNIDLYYDKSRDAWRTPAQVSALVRERMKLVPAGEDPVTAISRTAQAEPKETNNESVVDNELREVKATNRYPQINLTADPIGGLDRAVSVANSVIPMKVLGADGKLGVQLSAKEIGDMLTVMNITPDSDRIKDLHEIISEHSKLSTMPAEEVSIILSYGVKNMWGGGIDKASTKANIEASLKLWENNREKIRAQMTSAANIKKYANDFTAIREKLQGNIFELESSLRKFEGRELTDREQKAKQETARLLLNSQRELASATAMYQGRIQEDYEKILRFQDEIEATIANKSNKDAEEVVKKLERKNKNPRGISGKTSGDLIRERYPMAPWIGG